MELDFFLEMYSVGLSLVLASRSPGPPMAQKVVRCEKNTPLFTGISPAGLLHPTGGPISTSVDAGDVGMQRPVLRVGAGDEP
jgi:hypothetical protein